ncbi:glycoside hydrolase family 2 TIM barrel-domain containing protein [Flavobacterium ovatum]|uniref:glycoside hydrolase family 2 protein n=1 Tax=Flavobacterium ovatum TaxID=1928857 RepID=UPI00344EFC08
MKNIFQLIILLSFSFSINAQNKIKTPEFSKAGFFEVKDGGRTVYNFNIGWRLFLGESEDAFKSDFNDADWKIVNCPNGLQLNASEASGSVNYQGVAWYRKSFTPNNSSKGKKVKIHFEGVMGKCKIWLNDQVLGEHFGGYLPFEMDVTDKLKWNQKNIVVVKADNSDDPLYAPGKPQTRLDFAYFGGIYRDVFLVESSKVYVTNPNAVDKIAGGGIFVHVEKVSKSQATVAIQVDIQNDSPRSEKINATLLLIDHANKVVSKSIQKLSVSKGNSTKIKTTINVENPKLWSPWSPTLYRLEVLLTDNNQQKLDGVATRIGLRTIEFKGKEGFFLNNELYPGKLIGVNRHQDYGYVGNALPNNGQYNDVLIIKNGGCDIVRAAHYPADPAFMDACDALGLFYIEATPGWQFWNSENPIFEKRVYQDIRNMVRRDRNYASVIMWEPILNESQYPDYFAKKAHDLIHEEYPKQGAYTVCDKKADGQEYYDVIYEHDYNVDLVNENRCSFTREFGDNVDDFSSQNSTSRVSRGWGEQPQLIQAQFYADVPYEHTTIETLYNMAPQHIGGTLWAGFDHQRGYAPDPFYGGLTDVFRQTKYSYNMFKSQRNVSEKDAPYIFIAHEMTPFSSKDVTVYTNCEEVRLTLHDGMEIIQKPATKSEVELKLVKRGEPKIRIAKPYKKMPHPIVNFENVFDFMDTKNLHRSGGKSKSSILAEGLIGGKVVVSSRKTASKKPTRIQLTVEDHGQQLQANGSDFVVVVASIIDESGVVKRLNDNAIRFKISGEGEIIGDASIEANPKKLSWGTAPLLVKSTLKSGKIKVIASLVSSGINTPLDGEIEFESIPSNDLFIQDEIGSENETVAVKSSKTDRTMDDLTRKNKELLKKIIDLELKKEEKNQLEYDKNR